MISPESYSFARNPILFKWNGSVSSDPDIKAGMFYVEYRDKRVYEGRFTPPATINLAEIVDACVEWLPEPPDEHLYPLVQIEDSGDLENRRLHAFFEYSYADAELERVVIPGGISRQNFRQLTKLGTDIFTSRLMAQAGNFFMTTRTAGWCIYIRETELYPLYFFMLQTGDSYEFVDVTTGQRIIDDTMDEGVCALDLIALRNQFFNTCGVLPSVIDIYRNDNYACRIVIVRCDPSRERYRVKFRNSMGVFEIIEIDGHATVTPEYDADSAVFQQYDIVTDSFADRRGRISRKQSVSVNTGVKHSDEVRFMMDMIGSEEVYLLDMYSLPIQVIPSVDDFSYDVRQLSPANFTIKFELADSEINIMEDIIDGNDGMKSRIFSDQFNSTFN